MEYITVAEAAAAWQLSEQMIRKQCREGIIPGAYREGRSWLIPNYAQKHIPDTDREKKEAPHLARKLQKQKTKKSFHGLYDYIQIYFTYCSSRMASNRLSQKQIEMIYKKGKVQDCFEPVKVSDLVETLNHHVCIDYIIDHVMDPVSQKLIMRLHYLLMFGTVDERRGRVAPGQYRPADYKRPGRNLLPSAEIPSALNEMIKEYEVIENPEISDILNLHVDFEMISPFRDGNGRVGRLLMLKECLRHGITPFILDDKRRSDYLAGITKWSSRRKLLLNVVAEAQERFENQVVHFTMRQHGQNFLPENYTE